MLYIQQTTNKYKWLLKILFFSINHQRIQIQLTKLNKQQDFSDLFNISLPLPKQKHSAFRNNNLLQVWGTPVILAIWRQRRQDWEIQTSLEEGRRRGGERWGEGRRGEERRNNFLSFPAGNSWGFFHINKSEEHYPSKQQTTEKNHNYRGRDT
jgi:hypothetical protein